MKSVRTVAWGALGLALSCAVSGAQAQHRGGAQRQPISQPDTQKAAKDAVADAREGEVVQMAGYFEPRVIRNLVEERPELFPRFGSRAEFDSYVAKRWPYDVLWSDDLPAWWPTPYGPAFGPVGMCGWVSDQEVAEIIGTLGSKKGVRATVITAGNLGEISSAIGKLKSTQFLLMRITDPGTDGTLYCGILRRANHPIAIVREYLRINPGAISNHVLTATGFRGNTLTYPEDRLKYLLGGHTYDFGHGSDANGPVVIVSLVLVDLPPKQTEKDTEQAVADAKGPGTGK